MKTRICHKGGKLILIALMAQLILALPAMADSYAGNVFISSDALQGASIAGVFSSKPNQNSSGGLVLDDDYTITDNAVYAEITYAKLVTIIKSPSRTTYLLLTKFGWYAVKAVTLEKTYVPNITLESANDITFYRTDVPAKPIIGVIMTGYETAKVPLSYDPEYDYFGIVVAIWDYDNDGWLGATTGIKATPSDYKIGELIDSRTLETDADGKTYRFDVQGTVAGVDPSGWESRDFTTQPLAAAEEVPVDYLLYSTGLGLNTLAFAFDLTKGAIRAVDDTVVVAAGEVFTIQTLILEINRQSGAGNVVRTVGYYDNSLKRQVGLTAINYADLSASTATGDNVVNILGHQIRGEKQPYQVSVTADLTLILKGYK